MNENNNTVDDKSHDLLESSTLTSTTADLLGMGDSSNTELRSSRTKASRKQKVNLQGVPKCFPENTDALGLRLSPKISALKINLLDSTLNHVGIAHYNRASEEEIDPVKEHYNFKEVMKSPYEDHFTSAMVK